MNAVATICFFCSLNFFVLEAMSETRIVLIFLHFQHIQCLCNFKCLTSDCCDWPNNWYLHIWFAKSKTMAGSRNLRNVWDVCSIEWIKRNKDDVNTYSFQIYPCQLPIDDLITSNLQILYVDLSPSRDFSDLWRVHTSQ